MEGGKVRSGVCRDEYTSISPQVTRSILAKTILDGIQYGLATPVTAFPNVGLVALSAWSWND